MGNTSVVCGITAELCEPSVEKPGDGYIGKILQFCKLNYAVPNVVLSPLSHPKHRPGPPSDQAQSLSAQILNLILATSPDLPPSLCIERGKCVWTLYIDIQFLNYDGNALDSAWLALTATLSRVQLPPVQFNPDLNRGVVVDGVPEKLVFGGENTFACSFVGTDEGKYILIDPDEEEESLATENVSIVIDQEKQLRHLYKGGIGFKREDIRRCIELAGERAGYLSFVLEENASKVLISD
jgi:exosome complex component RRP43